MIASGARAVVSLGPSLVGLERCERELTDGRRAVGRGWYTPEEDERLRLWQARHLTARAALREVIHDLRPVATGGTDAAGGRGGADPETRLRAFVVGYAAACLLVRAARFLVDVVATHKLVQRKLNEPEPRFRIPRKQYTAIYASLTDPVHAWRLRDAKQFADRHRAAIDALGDDALMAGVLEQLRGSEHALDVPVPRYTRARARYVWHALRRRRASAVQKVTFDVAEAFGRLIADARNPWHEPRVTRAVRETLAALLEPGDVIVTRHDDALSNLFLPGYWPHASLFVGPGTLEARKDGVLYRELDDTLSVDALAVIRPRVGRAAIDRALMAAASHEGKLYNFDFDFFRSDRLVCTEVVYRAYDGVAEAIRFELRTRSGRPTLTAEDLLDMALDDRGFEPLAVFGAPSCPAELVTGHRARAALEASYRKSRA